MRLARAPGRLLPAGSKARPVPHSKLDPAGFRIDDRSLAWTISNSEPSVRARLRPRGETLSRELPLDVVLERKVRHAAETGVAFVRVRDIF